MFFSYNIYCEKTDERIQLCDAKINVENVENSFLYEYAKKICANSKSGKKCESLNVTLGIPAEIKHKIEDVSKEEYSFNKEAYCIDVGEKTNIYAESYNGIIYAITTLKHLIENDNLKEVFIYDKPYIAHRGYHAFIPGRNSINDFKKTVDDFILNYKYNTIIFEVGGAMEYKRHPKINEEWEKFGSMLLEESGIADRIQHYTYPWSKNAIHPENGGGSYLTQEELKDIIKYCNERGISVVPEIPSLSHADYIVRAYPEINERIEDIDPDTYCPSNPKTYDIMFDIIDEVFEVFNNPEYVSIGHDEVVTIGVCEQCKTKDASELFINDIQKLKEYINKKGSDVLMYGDKFCQLRQEDGSPYIDEKGKLCGGLQGYEKGDPRYVPAMYMAYEKLPKDVIISDWYWQYDFDYVFEDRKRWLANFAGIRFENWHERTKNVLGATASNWGRADLANMLRNGIVHALIFNSYLCWNKDYHHNDKMAIVEKTIKEMHRYYLDCVLNYSPEKKYVVINHTTDYSMPHKIFFDGDFVNEDDYRIGDYVLRYTDDTVYREKVIFGKNISGCNNNIQKDTTAIFEVSCATVPNECNGKTYYEWTFENPYPQKEIESISFEKANGLDINIFIDKTEY